MTAATRRAPRAKTKPGPTEGSEVDVAPLSEHVGFLLRIAQQNVFTEFHRRFASFGLTPARYSVLALLESNPNARQAAIADALHIKQPNFSVLIDAMELDGLVQRAIDIENRRANRLSLTAKGLSLFAETAQAVRRMDRSFGREFDAGEYEALLRTLRGFLTK